LGLSSAFSLRLQTLLLGVFLNHVAKTFRYCVYECCRAADLEQGSTCRLGIVLLFQPRQVGGAKYYFYFVFLGQNYAKSDPKGCYNEVFL